MIQIVDRVKRVGLHLALEARDQDTPSTSSGETTRSLNISGGGILFESRRNLQVGAHLTLAIEVPPALRRRFGGKAVYRARAVVCRVERFEGEGVTRVGARFLDEIGS